MSFCRGQPPPSSLTRCSTFWVTPTSCRDRLTTTLLLTRLTKQPVQGTFLDFSKTHFPASVLPSHYFQCLWSELTWLGVRAGPAESSGHLALQVVNTREMKQVLSGLGLTTVKTNLESPPVWILPWLRPHTCSSSPQCRCISDQQLHYLHTNLIILSSLRVELSLPGWEMMGETRTHIRSILMLAVSLTGPDLTITSPTSPALALSFCQSSRPPHSKSGQPPNRMILVGDRSPVPALEISTGY